MKASELMPGNIVLYEYEGQKNPAKVVEIYRDSVLVEDIIGEYEPIEIEEAKIYPTEITPEILEKNGFEIVSARDDNAGTMEMYFYPRIGYVYRFSNGEWEVDLIGYGRGFSGAAKYRCVIKYVHELQHVFRILKLEKEIEL